MRLRPLHDWVLIRRSEAADKTAGGVIIPESAKEKQAEGVVKAVGPGRTKKGKKGEKFIPTVIRPGQRVFFTDYAARDIELDGGKITLVREEDILGTLEGMEEVGARASHPVPMQKAGYTVLGEMAGTEPGEKGSMKTKKTSGKTETGKTARPKKSAKKNTSKKKEAKIKVTIEAKKTTTRKTSGVRKKVKTKKPAGANRISKKIGKSTKAKESGTKTTSRKKLTPGKTAVGKSPRKTGLKAKNRTKK